MLIPIIEFLNMLNDKLVVIYSDLISFNLVMSYLDKMDIYNTTEFIRVEDDMTDIQLMNSVFHLIPEGGGILSIAKKNDYSKINSVLNSLSTLKSANYKFYAFLGIDNINKALMYDYYYINIFDYLYTTENSKLFENLYYYVYDKHKMFNMLELMAANAYFRFIQDSFYINEKEIRLFQKNQLENYYDTTSGYEKMKQNLFPQYTISVILIKLTRTYELIQKSIGNEASMIDTYGNDTICDFSDFNSDYYKETDYFVIGLILDDDYDNFLIIRYLELGIKNINNNYNGIDNKKVSLKKIFFSGDYESLISELNYCIDNDIKIYTGCLNEKVFNSLKSFIHSKDIIFYNIAMNIEPDCNSNIIYLGGSIYTFSLSLYFIMDKCDSILILYENNYKGISLSNIYSKLLNEQGVTISLTKMLSCDTDYCYTNIVNILNKYVGQSTCLLCLLEIEKLTQFLNIMQEKYVDNANTKVICIDSNPIYEFDEEYDNDIYFFSFFNPSHLNGISETIIEEFINKYGYNILLSKESLLFYQVPLLVYNSYIKSNSIKVEDLLKVQNLLYIDTPLGLAYINENHYLNPYICIYIYQKKVNGKDSYITYYESSNPVNTEPYFPGSGLSCNNNKPIIKIGLIYSIDLSSEYYDTKLFLSAMAGFYHLRNEINTHRLSYKLFNLNGDLGLCYSLMKEAISEDYKIIFSGSSRHCMNKILNYSNSYEDVIFFFNIPTSGNVCYKNAVFTGGIPNQYFSDTLHYFLKHSNNNDLIYLIYNSANRMSLQSEEILSILIKNHYQNNITIDMSNDDEFNTKINTFINNKGLIMFISYDEDLNKLLYALYIRNRLKGEYDIVAPLITEFDFEDILSYFRRDIYLIGSYFPNIYDNDEINEFKKNMKDYATIFQPTSQMSNVYTAFLLLNQMINKIENDSEISVSSIYYNEIKTQEGEIYLSSNNYISKHFLLAKIDTNNEYTILYNSGFSEKPFPYHWSVYPGDLCDFTNAEIMERGSVVLIELSLAIYGIYNDISSIFEIIIDYFNSIGNSTGEYYKVNNYFLSSLDDCSQFSSGITSINHNLYLYSTEECLNRIIHSKISYRLNVISQTHELYCYNNIFFGGFSGNMIIPLLLQTVVNLYADINIILLYPEKYESIYTLIKYHANSLSLPVLYSNVNGINDWKNILTNYLSNRDCSIFIIAEADDNEVFDEMIKYVKEISSFKGKIFFTTILSYNIKLRDYPEFFTYESADIDSSENGLIENIYKRIKGITLYSTMNEDINSLIHLLYFWSSFDKYRISPNDIKYRKLLYSFSVPYGKDNIFMQRNNILSRPIQLRFAMNGTIQDFRFSSRIYVAFINNDENKICSFNEGDDPLSTGIKDVQYLNVGLVFKNAKNPNYPNEMAMYLSVLRLIDIYNCDYGYLSVYLKVYTYINFDDDFVPYGCNVVFFTTQFYDVSNQFFEVENCIYFYLAVYTYKNLTNVIRVGPSPDVISYLHYKLVMKDSYQLHLLYDDTKISNMLASFMDNKLSNPGILYYKYLVLSSIDYSLINQRVEDIRNRCSNSLYGCYIILNVFNQNLLLYLKAIYNSGLSLNNSVKVFTAIQKNSYMHNEEYAVYYNNTYTINIYSNELIALTTIGDTINDFIKYINVEFPYYEYGPYVSYTYSAWLIFQETIEKMGLTSKEFNSDEFISKVVYHQYPSPSGSIYISSDLYTQFPYYIFHYNSDKDSYDVELSTERMNPLNYQFNNEECDNLCIKLAIVLDYSNDVYIKSSNLLSLLVESLIIDTNLNGGVNNYTIMYKVFPYNNKSNIDKKTFDDLFSSDEYKFIIGTQTSETFRYLYLNYYNGLKKKLIYPLSFPFSSLCHENVFFVTLPLKSRVEVVIKYSTKYNTKNIVLIMQELNFGKTDEFIKYFKDILYKYYGENVIMNIFTFSFSSSDSDIENSVQYIYNTQGSLIVFNTLSSDIITKFETIYINYSIPSTRVIQIIFNLDDDFDNNLLKKLDGHIVLRNYVYSNYDIDAMSFYNYINVKIGDISNYQSLSNMETAYNIFIAGFQEALILQKEDGIESDELLVDYVRIGTQKIHITTSSGVKEGTTTNYFSQRMYLTEISKDAQFIIIDIDELKLPITASVSYKSPECYSGPKIEKNRLNNSISLGIEILIAIVTVIIYITATVLYHYRNFKVIKASSINFVIYFLISGTVTLFMILPLNLFQYNDYTCMIYQCLFYLSILNYILILVLRTWRIHAIYNNKDMKKLRISSGKIFVRLYIVLICFAVYSIIYGSIYHYSQYSEEFSANNSNELLLVYIPSCRKYLIYDIVFFIVLLTVFGFGLYFSYATRNCTDDYNDSKTLTTCIGCLFVSVVLYFSVEITLTTSPESRFLLESIAMILINCGITIVIVAPKFYKIIKNYSSMKPSSSGGKKESSFHVNRIVPISSSRFSKTSKIKYHSDKTFSSSENLNVAQEALSTTFNENNESTDDNEHKKGKYTDI